MEPFGATAIAGRTGGSLGSGDAAEPGMSFTRMSVPHVAPPSKERSKRTLFEAYDHQVARTVPFGETFTIPPRLPPPSATSTFGVQVDPPSSERENARSWRVGASVFHTQYRFPAASWAALSLSAKFGLSS